MSMLSSEDFLVRFFAPPNRVWLGTPPTGPVASALAPFLEALTRREECPLILPRREDGWEASKYYVICWNTAHAGRVRSLLEASIADHWAPFDGRVATLDSADPVESAILGLVGPGTTYLVRPIRETYGSTHRALLRLVRSLTNVPLRRPRLPRPIGRMLREFDLALSSGAAETSGAILREIEGLGGISHENVAFLKIRRLARLGLDEELLANRSLSTLVRAEPPTLVREGIVGAWTRTHISRPVEVDQVDASIEAVRSASVDVAMLVDDRLAASSDPDVSTFCALVALGARDPELAQILAENAAVDSAVRQRLEGDATPEPEPEPEPEIGSSLADDGLTPFEGVAEPATEEQAAITTWVEWVEALSQGVRPAVDVSYMRTWAPVWIADAEFADGIDGLPELAADDLLGGVAGFLDADEIDHPATLSAEAFLRRYLVSERFAPHDLGAINALLEIFLRGAPNAARYRGVLADIRDFADQWVAVATAHRAIDIVDTVALGPAPDPTERVNFVGTILAPLNAQKRRLSEALRGVASLVGDDVGLPLDWGVPHPPTDSPQSQSDTFAPRILLYSLDPGTLARTSKAIDVTWPHAHVYVSGDKVGGPALQQYARNSDLIVMATRRAAHAATGFITENADTALIRYPDGAGSASMIRAVESGLAELWS